MSVFFRPELLMIYLSLMIEEIATWLVVRGRLSVNTMSTLRLVTTAVFGISVGYLYANVGADQSIGNGFFSGIKQPDLGFLSGTMGHGAVWLVILLWMAKLFQNAFFEEGEKMVGYSAIQLLTIGLAIADGAILLCGIAFGILVVTYWSLFFRGENAKLEAKGLLRDRAVGLAVFVIGTVFLALQKEDDATKVEQTVGQIFLFFGFTLSFGLAPVFLMRKAERLSFKSLLLYQVFLNLGLFVVYLKAFGTVKGQDVLVWLQPYAAILPVLGFSFSFFVKSPFYRQAVLVGGAFFIAFLLFSQLAVSQCLFFLMAEVFFLLATLVVQHWIAHVGKEKRLGLAIVATAILALVSCSTASFLMLFDQLSVLSTVGLSVIYYTFCKWNSIFRMLFSNEDFLQKKEKTIPNVGYLSVFSLMLFSPIWVKFGEFNTGFISITQKEPMPFSFEGGAAQSFGLLFGIAMLALGVFRLGVHFLQKGGRTEKLVHWLNSENNWETVATGARGQVQKGYFWTEKFFWLFSLRWALNDGIAKKLGKIAKQINLVVVGSSEQSSELKQKDYFVLGDVGWVLFYLVLMVGLMLHVSWKG